MHVIRTLLELELCKKETLECRKSSVSVEADTSCKHTTLVAHTPLMQPCLHIKIIQIKHGKNVLIVLATSKICYLNKNSLPT